MPDAAETWATFKRHYGQPGDVLVWSAGTRTMNPTIPAEVVDRAMAADPEAAKSEWLGRFRRDLEAFVSVEVVDRATVQGRVELPPVTGVRYCGFVDAAGGSGADSMALGIGHLEGDVLVLDVVREATPPFSPDEITFQFSQQLRRYGCASMRADRYAAAWVVEAFERRDVTLRPARQTKSELLLELLGPLNYGRVQLLDHDRLRQQLV